MYKVISSISEKKVKSIYVVLLLFEAEADVESESEANVNPFQNHLLINIHVYSLIVGFSFWRVTWIYFLFIRIQNAFCSFVNLITIRFIYIQLCILRNSIVYSQQNWKLICAKEDNSMIKQYNWIGKILFLLYFFFCFCHSQTYLWNRKSYIAKKMLVGGFI